MIDLNDDTFLIYAMKHYDSPTCVLSEFEEDLKRLKYTKRLVKRYTATGDLKERLILNHIIVLANCFGVEASVRMLFYKFDEEDLPILKSFLMYLNYMPLIVQSIRGRTYASGEITFDPFVAKRLRTI